MDKLTSSFGESLHSLCSLPSAKRHKTSEVAKIAVEMAATPPTLSIKDLAVRKEAALQRFEYGLAEWEASGAGGNTKEAADCMRQVYAGRATTLLLGGPFTTLPTCIGSLTPLETLSLRGNQISSIPNSIGELSNLHSLEASENRLTGIPETIGRLTRLETLSLSTNQIRTLPPTIEGLTRLQELYLFQNRLEKIPEEVGNLKSLRTLQLGENKLTSLPATIGNLENLLYLDLSNNPISELPDELADLTQLQTLDLSNTQITRLSSVWGRLEKLTTLTLNEVPLKEPPIFFADLPGLQIEAETTDPIIEKGLQAIAKAQREESICLEEETVLLQKYSDHTYNFFGMLANPKLGKRERAAYVHWLQIVDQDDKVSVSQAQRVVGDCLLKRVACTLVKSSRRAN